MPETLRPLTPDDEKVKTKGGEAPDADKAADAAPDPESEGKKREEELLDEGLEETFPASDPVSAKHIT